MNTEDKNKLDNQGRKHGTYKFTFQETDYEYGNILEERFYRGEALATIRTYPLSLNLNISRIKHFYIKDDAFKIYCSEFTILNAEGEELVFTKKRNGLICE